MGDIALRTTIAETLTTPPQSPTVTIMLDQSMPVDEGGATLVDGHRLIEHDRDGRALRRRGQRLGDGGPQRDITHVPR
ncbi:hypothetical protein C6A85_08390, partial [Mycobacterium sp. ITM-2017-0098]